VIDASFWFVTVERIADGKTQQRRIRATTADMAGLLVRQLIGGPVWESYRVVRCVPG
jgi:hypothetical protein